MRIGKDEYGESYDPSNTYMLSICICICIGTRTEQTG